MISYLLYSTICMGLVLLFYHTVLAREKIYQINRCYLLLGLVLSLAIPFIPIGIPDSLLILNNSSEVSQILSERTKNSDSESVLPLSVTKNKSAVNTSNSDWIGITLLSIYSIVTIVLSFRMIRHLYLLKLKSLKNPVTSFEGHKVILVDKKIDPHTFCKTIFVNKEQFENREISQEVMIHELIHARQNHSIDIVIVEFLKTICWFNPILYFYKKAIQINHEYIADDKVLSTGASIADYQALLLKNKTDKSVHYLSTSLNFNVTKKRFTMMTLQKSIYRSSLKTALIIPFFLILGISFGCEPASMEEDKHMNFVNLQLIDAETIQINDKTVPASKFKVAFSSLPVDPKTTIINLKTYKNAPMGLLSEVQEVLRENGTLRINYSIKP